MAACACKIASATSSAESDSAAEHSLPVAVVATTTARAPQLTVAARSSRNAFEGKRSHSVSKASRPITSVAPRRHSAASSERHSVRYRWRCTGASGRKARDLKPLS